MALTINDKITNKLVLVQSEAKKLKFTFDVTIATATFDFIIKDLSGVTQVTKIDADFDKTSIAQKIVRVTLDTTDLNLAVGTYEAQLKTTWNATTSVDQTEIIKLQITKSLFS